MPAGSKKPELRGWQSLRLTEAELPRYFNNHAMNIGGLCGKPSGGWIDIDLDAPEAVAVAPHLLPPTSFIYGRDRRPRSHYGYRISDPPDMAAESFDDPTARKGTTGWKLLELRGTGAQSLLPGSTGPEGDHYRFDVEGEPAHVALDHLRAAVKRMAATALLARYWPGRDSHARHDAALAVSGFLLHQGVPLDDVRTLIRVAAAAAGDEEADGRAVDADTTAHKLAVGEPVTGFPTAEKLLPTVVLSKLAEWLGAKRAPAQLRHLTDLGNAERLVDRHGERIRYCTALGGWLVYDGRRWERDARAAIERLAAETVRGIYGEARACEDENRRRDVARWAIASESAARIGNLIALAQHMVTGAPRDFDRDRYLFNVANGTIDLRTGVLRQHRAADYITQVSPAVYDPAATCPTFDAFLTRIYAGRRGLCDYEQRFAGYCLTGDTREQMMRVEHGRGANGKGTKMRAYRYVWGDYAQTAETGTFVERRGDRISNDLAALVGARLVDMSEGAAGERLSEALIKRVTGQDAITARFLHHEFFSYEPAFKLVFATNHRPVIRDAGHAMWRRVKLIPFDVTIPDVEQDKELDAKLRAEAPGILAWAVRGCLLWLRNGLQEPAEVRTATDDYRAEQDILAPFLAECCRADRDASTTSGALYACYEHFCARNGDQPISRRTFGQRIAEHGYVPGSGTGGVRLYRGVRLRTPSEPPPDADGDNGQLRVAHWDPISDFSREENPREKKSEIALQSATCATPSPERTSAAPPCHWCKQPAPVGAQYETRWVCPNCLPRKGDL